MSNRIESIHNLARRKGLQLGIEPPVDMRAVISSLNIEIVEERNYHGIEAYSVLGDNPKIVINPEMTYYEPRRNFTLAHELGHIFIPWHNGDIKCKIEDTYIKVDGKRLLDTQELEANIFASDFLMPQEWLKREIEINSNLPFDSLIQLISQKANTSIMACFYAIERVLPSGYSYFVKRKTSDWWIFFTSHNTYTVNWFSFKEDRMAFFDKLALEKEKYQIGPYDIILYKMISCPSRDDICRELEKNGGSIELFIEKISKGFRLRVLPFLDVILESLTDCKYIAYLYHKNELVRCFYSDQSPLRRLYGTMGYEAIKEIVMSYGFSFESVELENDMLLLYVSEKKFEMPSYRYSDPNVLLRQICSYYGYDKHMLQSINGVMASVNSMYGKQYSEEELYNWSKYIFISNPYYEEVILHEDFDKYIVNKIISMKRKH